MPTDRRKILVALASAAGLAASACAKRPRAAAVARGLTVERLSAGAAALAERARPGLFDLGVGALPGGPDWSADGTVRFPVIGVAQAFVAAAALAEIDAGRLSLNEPIRIGTSDLGPPPSRINRLFPPAGGGQDYDVPAAALIALAVQHADVTAADVLLRRLGGPDALSGWLQSHGLSDIRISRPLRDCHAAMFGLGAFQPAWSDGRAFEAAKMALPAAAREAAMAAFVADPQNTGTTNASLEFLRRLDGGALLSPASTALLCRLMTAADPSRAGLAAGLPTGASIASVAGASGVSLGITPAAGVLALIRLSDGRRLALVAFLAGSTLSRTQRETLHARAVHLAVSSIV